MIQRTKPARRPSADLPEHHYDGATQYHGEVVPFYPNPLPQTAWNRFYLALAQVRDGANLTKGIPDLEKLIATLNPMRPEPFLDWRMRTAGWPGSRAMNITYRQSLRRDPAYLPALLELIPALKSAPDSQQSYRCPQSELPKLPPPTPGRGMHSASGSRS